MEWRRPFLKHVSGRKREALSLGLQKGPRGKDIAKGRTRRAVVVLVRGHMEAEWVDSSLFLILHFVPFMDEFLKNFFVWF